MNGLAQAQKHYDGNQHPDYYAPQLSDDELADQDAEDKAWIASLCRQPVAKNPITEALWEAVTAKRLAAQI